MRTEKQIEVFFFKKGEEGIKFLLMKRAPERGGFWQPMTGGVEEGETLEDTIRREAIEETGIKDIIGVVDTGLSYEFDDNGKHHVEYIFGVEVAQDTEVTLSHEHTEYKWLDKNEAMTFLKWPGNKKGLTALSQILAI